MSQNDLDRLAAEHVMGLLEGEERREAERLLVSDTAFQELVFAWQARFAELDETVMPVPAGDALWHRIEQALEKPAEATSTQEATTSESGVSPAVVPDSRSAFADLWRSLPFWRAAGLAGAFATIVLAVGLSFLAERSARAPVLVAVLLNDANQPAGIVNVYRDGQGELVPFAGMQIPQGRAFEIWAIPGPNQNPISVGVVTEPRSVRLDLQRVQDLRPDQTFAISVEPPQGSPTGLPTGPVLLKGTTTTAL